MSGSTTTYEVNQALVVENTSIIDAGISGIDAIKDISNTRITNANVTANIDTFGNSFFGDIKILFPRTNENLETVMNNARSILTGLEGDAAAQRTFINSLAYEYDPVNSAMEELVPRDFSITNDESLGQTNNLFADQVDRPLNVFLGLPPNSMESRDRIKTQVLITWATFKEAIRQKINGTPTNFLSQDNIEDENNFLQAAIIGYGTAAEHEDTLRNFIIACVNNANTLVTNEADALDNPNMPFKLNFPLFSGDKVTVFEDYVMKIQLSLNNGSSLTSQEVINLVGGSARQAGGFLANATANNRILSISDTPSINATPTTRYKLEATKNTTESFSFEPHDLQETKYDNAVAAGRAARVTYLTQTVDDNAYTLQADSTGDLISDWTLTADNTPITAAVFAAANKEYVNGYLSSLASETIPLTTTDNLDFINNPATDVTSHYNGTNNAHAYFWLSIGVFDTNNDVFHEFKGPADGNDYFLARWYKRSQRKATQLSNLADFFQLSGVYGPETFDDIWRLYFDVNTLTPNISAVGSYARNGTSMAWYGCHEALDAHPRCIKTIRETDATTGNIISMISASKGSIAAHLAARNPAEIKAAAQYTQNRQQFNPSAPAIPPVLLTLSQELPLVIQGLLANLRGTSNTGIDFNIPFAHNPYLMPAWVCHRVITDDSFKADVDWIKTEVTKIDTKLTNEGLKVTEDRLLAEFNIRDIFIDALFHATFVKILSDTTDLDLIPFTDASYGVAETDGVGDGTVGAWLAYSQTKTLIEVNSMIFTNFGEGVNAFGAAAGLTINNLTEPVIGAWRAQAGFETKTASPKMNIYTWYASFMNDIAYQKCCGQLNGVRGRRYNYTFGGEIDTENPHPDDPGDLQGRLALQPYDPITNQIASNFTKNTGMVWAYKAISSDFGDTITDYDTVDFNVHYDMLNGSEVTYDGTNLLARLSDDSNLRKNLTTGLWTGGVTGIFNIVHGLNKQLFIESLGLIQQPTDTIYD